MKDGGIKERTFGRKRTMTTESRRKSIIEIVFPSDEKSIKITNKYLPGRICSIKFDKNEKKENTFYRNNKKPKFSDYIDYNVRHAHSLNKTKSSF